MSVAVAPVRSEALTGAVLRALWFGVVPGLLTIAAMRYLLVTPVRAPLGTLHDVSEWADAHQVQAAVLLFLVFSALARYWRSYLPAAARWAEPVRKAQSGKLSALIWLGLLGLAGGGALLLRGSFFQSYQVLSGSMLPTLEPFEMVLSNQSAYGFRWPGAPASSSRAPARGDVIVFRYPPIRPDVPEELVKRVIGLPGDTILTRGGYAFINDWRVPTCEVGTYVYVSGDGLLEAHMRMEFLEDRTYLTAHGPWQPDDREPFVVPAGQVFLLGDNRNNSSDSRAWNDGRGGGLPFEKIGGRVDRVLIGKHRDGSWDFSRFFQPLSRLEPHLENIDDRDLRAGIEHCLKQRPKDTRPPPPGAQQVAP